MSETIAYERGANEARVGYAYDPAFWKYAPHTLNEYEYALGYASECDIAAATSTVKEWEEATPAQRAQWTTQDVNAVFAANRR